ncbi:lipase-like isoform X2 [Helianthus annuus]|uniref:lipase-like isoform X2 n=1 Tax=Helianthus annuus TaxID=4232 RepID=UPI00165318B9|nr:lipase-like isoform X2 [Helianthus annuus]
MVTGHSMGGAMAAFCGLDLALIYGSKNIQFTTFGMPRIGNAAFASYYGQVVPSTFRVTHGHDLVLHLPPYYHHFPQKKYHHFPSEGHKFEYKSNAKMEHACSSCLDTRCASMGMVATRAYHFHGLNMRFLAYDMADMEESVTPVFTSFLKSGVWVFLFSDQDSILPLSGTRARVNGLAKQ